MKIIKLVITVFFALSFFSPIAKAQTERLDNLAACAGVVIGNGAVDFSSNKRINCAGVESSA